jgi:hypothetical protein
MPTDENALDATFKLARREGLAAYDAAYLELALRLNLPLATLDSRLAEAASRCGVCFVVFGYAWLMYGWRIEGKIKIIVAIINSIILVFFEHFVYYLVVEIAVLQFLNL